MADDLLYTVRTEYVGDGLSKGRADVQQFSAGLVTAQKGADGAAGSFGSLESTLQTLADENSALRSEVDELREALGRLSDQSDKTKLPDTEKPRKSHAALATAVVGLGLALGAATVQASKYQQSVTLISTLSQETADRFQEYKAGILDVSAALGQDAVVAANAAYNALSSGIAPDAAVSFLETASKAATAGVTSVDNASAALTVTLNSFNLEASQATAVSDAMFATANVGVTTFDELASSFGGVASIAASSNASYQETLALLGQITTKGTNTAQAVTEMKATFIALSKPVPVVKDALAAAGFASAEAAIQANGLQYVLELVRQTSVDTGKPLIELVGSAEAVSAILKTTGDNGDATREKIALVGDSAGATAAAFDLIDETPAQKMKVFQASLQAAALTVGDAFLPVLSSMLDAFIPLIQGGTELARLVGGVLTGGFELLGEPLQLVAGLLLGFAGVAGTAAVGSLALGSALTPVLSQMGLMEPAGELAKTAFSKIAGSAGAAGAGLKAALGPIGLVLAAVALLSKAHESATAAIEAEIASVKSAQASLGTYSAAAQRARDEAGALATLGFGVRDSMAVQEEQALRNRAAIEGFLGTVARGWGSVLGPAAEAIGGLAGAQAEATAEAERSAGAIIDGANAWLQYSTNVDPAILKSTEFKTAQAQLSQDLRSGKLEADQYGEALLREADALSQAAGGAGVFTNAQLLTIDAQKRSFDAIVQRTAGLSEAALATDDFRNRETQLAADVQRGALTQEQATSQLLDYARVLTAQDDAYQQAISGNEAFDAAYNRLVASYDAGQLSAMDAVLSVHQLGEQYGISAEKAEEASQRILHSSAAIPAALKNAGISLDMEAMVDPEVMAERIGEANAAARQGFQQLFSEQLQASQAFQAELGEILGGGDRVAVVADLQRQLTAAESAGNTERAALLQQSLNQELAGVDQAGRDRIASVVASFEQERQARLTAIAQTALDQLNTYLATGQISPEQAQLVFGALKDAAPDSTLFDPAAEAALNFNAKLGQALSSDASAEDIVALRDGLAGVDVALQQSAANADAYGQESVAAFQAVEAQAGSSAGAVVAADGLVTASADNRASLVTAGMDGELAARQAAADGADESAGAVEDADARAGDSASERAARTADATDAEASSYSDRVAQVEGAATAEQAALGGLVTAHGQTSRAVESGNARIGDSTRGMGADVQAGAAGAASGFRAIPAAADSAATELGGSVDRMVGEIDDAGQQIRSADFDVAPVFEGQTDAIDGVGAAAQEAARQQVSASQDAARAAASSSDEVTASHTAAQTAASGLVTATGELATAYEGLPTEVETEVVLDDAAARSALKFVRDQMAAIDGKKIRFEIIGQYLGAGRAAAGSPLLVLQDLWAIQEAASQPFVLAGSYAGTGLATASGNSPLGLRTELEAIHERAAHPVVFDVRAVLDPDFASFMRDLLGSEGAVSSAVRDELDAINGLLADAQRVASGLADQIDFLTDSFLRGGEGDEGSLAWLMGEWERGGFEFNVGDLFSELNLPVDTVEQFADLLDQLAASGQADRAAELWNRFYDGITERQEAYHDQRMAGIEREREAAEAAFEVDKRRIEELIQIREEEHKKSGGTGDTPKIERMSDEVDRIEAAYADLLATLGFTGDTALRDFYEAMTGGARKGIETNEDLTEAVDLLGEALSDHWDQLEADADASHAQQMALLDERIRMIGILGQDHAAAEAEVNRLLAAREQLIEDATRALQAQQKAAEDGEKQAHDLVMEYLDEQAEAREDAHDREMRDLDLRRDAIEAQRDQARDIHDEKLSQLKAEEDALKAKFEAEQKVIDSAKIALERLELGGELSQEQADLLRSLGIDPEAVAEAAKEIEQAVTLLDELKSLSSSLPDDDRSRVSLKGNPKISDAETAALKKALDANLKNRDGTDVLSESDRRIIEVALAGGGVNTGRLKGILDKVTGKLEDDQAAADSGGALNPLEEARQILGLLENTQKTKKQQLDEDIAGIAARREAENQRWEREQANFDARIAAIEATKTAAKEAYDAERQAIDDAREAERQRHEDRMAQIQAEYALELLRLGKTEAEVQAIIAAQQASASRIAEESAKRWSDLQAEIAARQAAIRAEEEAARRRAEGAEATAPGRFPATPPAQPAPPGGEGGRGSGGIRKPGIGAGGAEIDLALVTDALRDALDAAAPLGVATDDLARRLDDLAAADASGEIERMADELDRLRRDDPLGGMADDFGVLADSALKSALVVRDDFWAPMQDEALRLLSYTRDAKRELQDLMRAHAEFDRDRDRDDDDGPGGRPAARVVHIHGDVHIYDRETAEDLGLLDAVGAGRP